MEGRKGGDPMIEKLERAFALSEKGARDMINGFAACTVHNLTLFAPVSILYFLIADLLHGTLEGHGIWYAAFCIISVLLMMLSYRWVYGATYFSTYVESGVRRVSIAEKLRKIPLSYFGKKDLADITSTIMSDAATLETGLSHWVPELAGSMLSTAIAAVSMLFFDVRMGLAVLWPLPVAFLIVVLSGTVQSRLSRRSMDAKMKAADGIQEYIETIRDLKSCNAEHAYLARLFRKIDDVEKRAIISEAGTAVFVVSASFILKIGIGTAALAGSVLLVSGEIDVLTFFLYLLIASRIYDPLQSSLQNLAAIISLRTNVGRMDEILFHPLQEGSKILTNKGYDIEFRDVHFSYDGKDEILSGVSFIAKQGEVTALVGPSGGGKTTASRLAARFWDIQSGQITVGGMDIGKTDPESLLSLYSIVFQDVVLFDNTIMENIRIGRRGASDEEVIEAGKMAQCLPFVEKLENGWNTMIGENGCELSGGERQRISIARAFLKDSPIILLDEATASLDAENETEIQKALSGLIRNKTVLVIAHRMRTVENADKIIVLSGGQVAEEGTPSELMESGGLFSRMAALQKESSMWRL